MEGRVLHWRALFVHILNAIGTNPFCNLDKYSFFCKRRCKEGRKHYLSTSAMHVNINLSIQSCTSALDKKILQRDSDILIFLRSFHPPPLDIGWVNLHVFKSSYKTYPRLTFSYLELFGKRAGLLKTPFKGIKCFWIQRRKNTADERITADAWN